MWVGQRLQQDTFEDAEDYGVCANVCRESYQGDGCEERGTAEASQNLSQLVADHLGLRACARHGNWYVGVALKVPGKARKFYECGELVRGLTLPRATELW